MVRTFIKLSLMPSGRKNSLMMQFKRLRILLVELNKKKELLLLKMPFRRLKTQRQMMERLMLQLKKLRMPLLRELKRLRKLLVKMERKMAKTAKTERKKKEKMKRKRINCDHQQSDLCI